MVMAVRHCACDVSGFWLKKSPMRGAQSKPKPNGVRGKRGVWVEPAQPYVFPLSHRAPHVDSQSPLGQESAKKSSFYPKNSG